VGNDDELGLLALHQRGDSVHTCRVIGTFNFPTRKHPSYPTSYIIFYFGQCSGLKSSKASGNQLKKFVSSLHQGHISEDLIGKSKLTNNTIIDCVFIYTFTLLLTSTEDRGPLGRGVSLPSSLQLSAGQQPLLLLLLGLWPVLVGQLEQLCG